MHISASRKTRHSERVAYRYRFSKMILGYFDANNVRDEEVQDLNLTPPS
jgi:hypothetical protein